MIASLMNVAGLLLLVTLWVPWFNGAVSFSLSPEWFSGRTVDHWSTSIRKRRISVVSLTPSYSESMHEHEPSSLSHLVFPGGGIYFYWQAGAVTYLRECGYNLNDTTLSGASAGALTATLTATNVDFYKATDLALALARQAGVWNRSAGLQGIWGPLISTWLDELLPDNALELIQSSELACEKPIITTSRLSLLLTPVPSLGKERINIFLDRQDLIQANAASVHLPWFLDSKLTATFRDRPYIDGSFLSRPVDYMPAACNSPSGGAFRHTGNATTIRFDYNQDPFYRTVNPLSFIDAVTPDGIYKILEHGKRYAAQMEEQGMFATLSKAEHVATT